MHKKLEPYAQLVSFLGEALGENVEVVLHDLTTKNQEIVAIKNNQLSKREVGARLSNLSLHYLETQQYKEHDFVTNYKTIEDGKLIRSATYFIKDSDYEQPIGMLCINVNISDYAYLEATIKRILGIKDTHDEEFEMENPIQVFSNSLEDMISMYIKECLEMMGFPIYFQVERLNVQEKIKVVKYLQEKGIFEVKRAISLVAEVLAVSEPTVYRYLKKI